MRAQREVEDRFWSKVAWGDPDSCWLWQGAQTGSGSYGIFSFGPAHNRTMVVAHRMAYTLEVGEIPEGLVLDHLCRTKACVNPDHLEPVTQSVNNLRGNSPRIASAFMKAYHERRRNA